MSNEKKTLNAFKDLRRYINEYHFKFDQERAQFELNKYCDRTISLGLIQGIEQGKNSLQTYHADAIVAFLLAKELISEADSIVVRNNLLMGIPVSSYLRNFEHFKERTEVLLPHIQDALFLKKRADFDFWLAKFSKVRCIGRENFIVELMARLGAQARIIISDFGGTGKSTVAAKIAQRYLERDDDSAVIWIDVGDGTDKELEAAVTKVLNQKGNVAESRQKWQDLLRKNNVGLIVLDNVWRVGVLNFINQIPGQIAVLLTSRIRLTSNALEAMELPSLNKSEGLEVFLSELSRMRNIELEAAIELCKKLKNHPLALKIAAASISAGGLSVREVIDNLDDYVINNDTAYEKRLSTLIEQSLENPALTDREDVRSVFYAMGALFAPSAPTSLLKELLLAQDKSVRLLPILFDLNSLNLISRDPQNDAYTMHDLVFAYVISKLSRQQIQNGLQTCYEYVSRFIEVPNGFSSLHRVIYNLIGAVVSAISSTPPDWKYGVNLLYQIAVSGYFDSKGYPDSAIQLLMKAADQARELQLYRQAHYLFIKASNGLTEYRQDLDGALIAAVAAAECAHMMTENEEGEAENRRAIALSVAGAICVRNSDFDKAAAYFDAAEEVALTRYSPEALSQICEHRGYFYAIAKRDIPTAVKSLNNSLMYAQQIENPKVKLTRLFYAFMNLGQAAREQGNTDTAFNLYAEAEAVAESQQNDDWLARVSQEIGKLYWEMDFLELAREKLCHALKLYRYIESPRLTNLMSYLKANRITCDII